MDVRHLELLRELADRGSVTAVAAATHRTVSAVSQQLRTAQREFGMALVEPDGRGVRLTDAGRLLADGAVSVQSALAQVQATWDAYRDNPGGEVSMLAFPSAAALIFPPALRAAADAGVRLRLHDRDPAEADFARLSSDVDIVIGHSLDGRGPVGTDGLDVVHLTVEPLDIAMRADHPLTEPAQLRARDVAEAEWIGVPDGYPFDAVLRAVAAAAGRELSVPQRLRDNRVMEAMVRASDAVCVLPRFTTVADDGLVLREIVDVHAERTLSAVMRPDRARRRAVQTVLDAVVDALAEFER
ncbi:LysR family transcriptional regulator [Gordonia spumicola]|uniref:LysR family transcriptional regulator n=1 Tax=Gordonia spumicola TaxID=589161 RepID=A0A7I9V9P2_9ACTN|nr:LysR family transcriptional regulator [Gordonia spumicola]GEE01962.1 LysR family transcriptional regulator [Gordonia spumicola]